MSSELVGFENLPNAFIKEIKIEEINSSGLVVTAKVRIHDLSSESVWFNSSEMLTKLLRVGFFFSTDPTVSTEINSGEIDILSIKQIESKSVFVGKEEDDKLIFDFIFSKTIPANISHLNVYSFCFIDKKQISENFGFFISKNFLGPIKAEKVFTNNSVAGTTSIFLRENGEYWSGPVHEHNGVFMEGAMHTTEPHGTLIRNFIRNTKIKDLRKNSKRQITNKMKNLNFASDLFVSYNSETDVNSIFMLNMKSLLMGKTKFGAFLRNASDQTIQEIMSKLKIKLMTIERERIKVRSQSTFLRTSRKKPKQIFSKKSICKTYDEESRIKNISRFERRKRVFDLDESELRTGNNNTRLRNEIFAEELTSYEKISEINEMFFEYGEFIRTFQFNDFSLKSKTPGDYRYKVSVSFNDPTRNFLIDLIQDIKFDLSNLYNFRSLAARSKNLVEAGFDYADITNSFVKNFSYIYNTAENEKKRLFLKMAGFLHPTTATLQTIKKFILEYESLLHEIYKFSDFDSSFIKSHGRSVSLRPKEPMSSRITFEKTFEKIITPSFNKIAFSYINKETSKTIKILTKEQILNSANKTTNDLYVSTANAATEETSTQYWSAEGAQSENQTVDLSGVDATVHEADLNSIVDLGRPMGGLSLGGATTQAGSSQQPPIEGNFVNSSDFIGENHEFVNYSNVEQSYNVSAETTEATVKFGNYFSGFQNNRSFATTLEAAAQMEPGEGAALPNQLKSVILGDSADTRNDYISSQDDFLANPNTKNYYEVNNFSVQKLSYVDRFSRDNEGNILLNKPIFKEMSYTNFSLLDKPVLCFLQAYTNNRFKITDENQKSVLDSVFIMSNQDLTVPRDPTETDIADTLSFRELFYQFMNSEIVSQTNNPVTVSLRTNPLDNQTQLRTTPAPSAPTSGGSGGGGGY